jgi:hypothetical protein
MPGDRMSWGMEINSDQLQYAEFICIYYLYLIPRNNFP